MARVLAFAVSAAALVAPPTQQTRRPVTARAVVSEPIPSSVSSKDTLVAAAEAFDLQGYFAKKVQAVEKALDASIQCTTPETKKIVESMRYSLLAAWRSKFYGAFDLHAIDATPARWCAPGDLSPFDSVRIVAFSPWKDLVHPTHWLIYAQVGNPLGHGQ